MKKKADSNFIKRNIKDWLKVAVLLLDEVAAMLLVIVILRVFGIKIPLSITVVIVVLLGIVIFIIHRAVIPSFHWRVVTGQEGMIGTLGKVVEPLTPLGTIIVNGERWKAKSINENIGVAEDVEITGIEGLTLKVKRKVTGQSNGPHAPPIS